MEVGMLAQIPVGRCCARPRYNAVGGIDQRAWPSQVGTALRRKLRSIAGDRAELMLPETGACNRSAAQDANNCCEGPALSDVDACCVADANAKQQGATGCGCASQAQESTG
jgi:hypothetical protein